MQIGYCANVHSGQNLAEVKHNLTEVAFKVKEQFSPNEALGIGLWFSATCAREFDDRTTLLNFRDWLQEVGLVPYTLNGFPFGDFHQDIVKHDVYRPTWAQPDRLDYTLRLAEILCVLLPESTTGTISTLPLGWPIDGSVRHTEDQEFWKLCARNLRACADRLAHLYQSTGHALTLCIEPEPGCILDTCDDLVGFFNQNLRAKSREQNDRIRKHLGVCHDVCHSAVMFEKQADAVKAYQQGGVRIGKVQISSAVAVDFDSGSEEDRMKRRTQLEKFSEQKYLHQTSVRKKNNALSKTEFFEDLNIALASEADCTGQWRVHFHVPIFADKLDLIDTTQDDIPNLINAIADSCVPPTTLRS